MRLSAGGGLLRRVRTACRGIRREGALRRRRMGRGGRIVAIREGECRMMEMGDYDASGERKTDL